MKLGLTTTTTHADDQRWLANMHGVDEARSITLDVSTFTEADHYPNGYIPSGVALGRITATGLYGPYDNAAVDGRTTCAGFLLEARTVDRNATTVDVAGALLERGTVIEANLPDAGAMTNGGIDANGKTDLGVRFLFR